MGFFDFFRRQKQPTPRVGRRGWAAAQMTPLAGMVRNAMSPNQDLFSDLVNLRARANHLYGKEPVVRSYILSLQEGLKPFTLSSRVTNTRNGINTSAAAKVETAWFEFTRAGNFDVTERLSLDDVLDLVVVCLVVEGEAFIRRVTGRGPFGLSYQVIHPALVPVDAMQGDYLDMGIPSDEWGKPISYTVKTKHQTEGGGKTIQVPADQMIHLFIPHAPGARRGVPLIANSIPLIDQLGEYRAAVITAARMTAAVSQVYEQDGSVEDEGYLGPAGIVRPDGEDAEEELPDDGRRVMVPGALGKMLEPGSVEVLPVGVKKTTLATDKALATYDSLATSVKKEISAGMGLSYPVTYNDFADMSYSSSKAAMLQDAAFIGHLQRLVADRVLSAMFRDFVRTAGPLGKLGLPAVGSSYDAYLPHEWILKPYAYIDPVKEAQARIQLLEAGLTTRTDILAELGKDYEEHLQRLQTEKELAHTYGIEFPPLGKPETQTPPAPETKKETKA